MQEAQAITLEPPQRALTGDLWILQSAPRLNLVLTGLEFKLTLLSQQRLCYKNFLELLVFYFP